MATLRAPAAIAGPSRRRRDQAASTASCACRWYVATLDGVGIPLGPCAPLAFAEQLADLMMLVAD
jgi:hypothetical protein